MWVGMGYASHLEHIKRRSILPVFDRYLPKRARILEAGCGFGAWIYHLNERGFRAVGVDLNARLLAGGDRTLVPMCRNDVLNLCFADDTFDAYLSLGVVEHFPEGPHRPLAEALRVLKSGGIAFISTPTTNPLRTMVNHPVRRVVGWLHRLRGRRMHFAEYRFSRGELVEHIRRAGFEILETVPNDTRLDQHRYSIGFYTDWPPLRSRTTKYELNGPGRFAFRVLKALSPSLVVSGILVVARKPAAGAPR